MELRLMSAWRTYLNKFGWSEGSFSTFLKPVSMSGCLALRTGSLLMAVFHQLASGMSCANLVS
eukprot:146926-Pelagomonas_calceolata.AAC.1